MSYLETKGEPSESPRISRDLPGWIEQQLAEHNDLTVLDVRTPAEFADGHLKGAELIDFYGADFQDQLSRLNRDARYVIYCRSGGRSEQALNLMANMGFVNVTDMIGGIVAWISNGHPIVAPEA